MGTADVRLLVGSGRQAAGGRQAGRQAAGSTAAVGQPSGQQHSRQQRSGEQRNRQMEAINPFKHGTRLPAPAGGRQSGAVIGFNSACSIVQTAGSLQCAVLWVEPC